MLLSCNAHYYEYQSPEDDVVAQELSCNIWMNGPQMELDNISSLNKVQRAALKTFLHRWPTPGAIWFSITAQLQFSELHQGVITGGR